jgi:hypothetical protein
MHASQSTLARLKNRARQESASAAAAAVHRPAARRGGSDMASVWDSDSD